MKLYPTLPIIDGESVTSWVSRLARINGRTLRGFCSDMRLSVYRLVDGCASVLSDLAYMASAEVGMLHDASIASGHEGWRLKGERLMKTTLRRERQFVCPRCLLEDADIGGEIRMHGRIIWSLAPIRTCAVHEIALVDLGASPGVNDVHDFALRLSLQGQGLERFAATAVHRAASSMEKYLIARLEGYRASESGWLDGLEWHAAASTCEMLGAISLFGREPMLKTLSMDDWRNAGEAGFSIASEGADKIRAFLADLHSTYPFDRSAVQGPQAVYGKFYKWLAFSAADASFDPVRKVVADEIEMTFPLAPGDLIFGETVQCRTIHSIRTASLENGLHPKRLRKILAAAGILPADHASKADGDVRFDAAAAAPILKKARNSISEEEVRTYLNAGRVQTAVLRREGIIAPWLEGNGLGDAAFDRQELDEFLSRLLERATEVVDREDTWCDIPQAAKRANCGASEIVRAILDGSLESVGRDPGIPGYMSTLVRVDEVRTLVRGAPLAGLTAQQIQIRLGTTHRVTKSIIGVGLLPVSTKINPVNRCPVKLTAVEDFEHFAKAYVLSSEVARAWKTHPSTVRKRLSQLGIGPAFKKSADFPTDIYLRSDVDLSE